MPEHTSSWTIGAGSVIVLFSLCLLAAAVTDRSDQGLLAIAAMQLLNWDFDHRLRHLSKGKSTGAAEA